MPRYYRRKDGLYETSRTIGGKRVFFRAKTCAEVDRKILNYREKRKTGRSFEAVADDWFEAKEKELRSATLNSYRFALNVIRGSEMNTTPVNEITPLSVKRFVNAVEQQGYSGSSVATILHVIKAVFSYAVIAGDIDINPATEVTRSRNLPKTERTALTEEEEAKVEAYRGDDFLLGLLLLYTGLRKGEAMALTWQDVDREHGVIHITKKVNFTTRPQTVDNFLKSKNGKRDVPILAPLAAVLPANRIGLVFHDAHGAHVSESIFARRWHAYCEAVGIKATPHQFRHSYATILYEAGIDAISAAAMMGDTPEVVSRIYTELRKSHHEQQAEQVSAYLEMRAGLQATM